MSDEISFCSDINLEQDVKKILSHTNYSEEEATKKLKLFNYDYMKVIRDYMGISEKKQQNKVKSINQEIYRQLRIKLDNSMKEYREKNPINMGQVMENFKESDEREKNKIKN